MKRKKIGLVLGGGGARGLAHIGVLKILEKNKIPIDYIAGTSIGAVIGALYAESKDYKELEKLANNIHKNELIDLEFSRKGLIKGKKIETFLRKKLKSKKIEELKIPLLITALNKKTNKEVIFHKGDIAKALRASISVPKLFQPVKDKKRLLIDGSWKNALPIQALKNKGADIIIAVNLIPLKEDKNIIYLSLKELKNKSKFSKLDKLKKPIRQKKSSLNILIQPSVEKIKMQEFKRTKSIIKKGENTIKREIKQIKKLIKNPNIIDRVKQNLDVPKKSIFSKLFSN